MTENVTRQMVERMIALVRKIAGGGANIVQGVSVILNPALDEARAIAAELPAPIDPDDQYARDLLKAQGWSGEPSIGGEAVALMIATAHRDGRILATQGDS